MIRTIYAKKKGGSVRRVAVLDPWHRARISARSLRARGLSVGMIARILGVDLAKAEKLAAPPAPWWQEPARRGMIALSRQNGPQGLKGFRSAV